MPRTKLTLTIPDDVWIGDVSRSHPQVRFRILAAVPGDETGVGLVELIGSNLPAVVADLEGYEPIIELDFLQQAEDKALVQFETTTPLFLFPLQDSGIPLEMPFSIQDRNAEWEVTAPQDRLSELGEQLETFGISFTVEWIRQHVEPEQVLTDRQEHLLTEAADRGYYDTPRKCSLTELADELNLAKSTCSEVLHRAEGAVIKRFLQGSQSDSFVNRDEWTTEL